MIVLDASATVDLLLDVEPSATHIQEHLVMNESEAHVPHLLDAEVAQALRRFVLRAEIHESLALRALGDLGELPLVRYDHGPLLGRAFELRDNVTIYDGLYIALAESLGAQFLTCDVSLSRAPGVRAPITVVGG